VHALEKHLETRLLDRSGRRVTPTEAGMRLYRGARRLLILETQVIEDVRGVEENELHGVLEIGCSTGPSIPLALLMCEFGRLNPNVHVALSVFDTQRVIERVAARQLELGVVGASPRHRSVQFEPLFRDELVLVVPPGHPFAGRTVAVDELRDASLIVMQDGAGVRQVIEDELRARGIRLRDLGVHLELGLQESVKTAVQRGYGVTFISRTSVQSELEAGLLGAAHVEGLEPSREVMLVRAAGRSTSRAAEAFLDFARGRLDGTP
jgi:DNA-binding transcriptional LysR family regulator